MKKVLFVVDEKKLGGVNVVLLNLLNNLDLTNLKIDLLILHNSGTYFKNLNKQINIIYGTKAFDIVDQDFKNLFKSGHIIKAIKKSILALRMKMNNMENFIQKERKKLGISGYDVEISFKSGFCSFLVAYSDANKKINWIHEDYSTFNKTKKYERTFKKLFDMFDIHVGVSDKAIKSFNDIYHMEQKTCVIENYIDEENIKIQSLKDLVPLEKNKMNIVTLGRFSFEKGFDRLIEAVYHLKSKLDVSNIKIHILGYGKLENALKKQISTLNLNDIIQVYNTNKLEINPYAFIKECDLFIMPSRSESFGMSRIEALILGLPVITTNVANSNELILKEYGMIVENSINGLIIGLENLITNNKLLNTLKDNVKYYSYNKKNKEIINQVQQLLEDSSETKKTRYTE